MHPQPQPTQPENNPGQQAEDAQYYRRVLHGLIDMGAELAGIVLHQAKARSETPTPAAAPAPHPTQDFTIPFDRIARAIRRTVLLARKIAEPAPAASQSGQHRAAARKQIIREVENAIAHRADPDEAASLHAELRDRLDAPDLEDDIQSRPIAEIIAEIRRDLGVAPLSDLHPWERRTPADIEILCARAAARSATTGAAAPGPLPQPAVIARKRPPRTGPFGDLPTDPGEAIARVLEYGALQR